MSRGTASPRDARFGNNRGRVNTPGMQEMSRNNQMLATNTSSRPRPATTTETCRLKNKRQTEPYLSKPQESQAIIIHDGQSLDDKGFSPKVLSEQHFKTVNSDQKR